jgi:hypothetical protein
MPNFERGPTMSATVRSHVVLGVRAVPVGGGGAVAAAVAYGLATIPSPPPGSDGFVSGLAYIFGGVLVVLALGTAALASPSRRCSGPTTGRASAAGSVSH